MQSAFKRGSQTRDSENGPWPVSGRLATYSLHAGFFTGGFHIAFLVTHLPGEVNPAVCPASVASWSLLALIGLSTIVIVGKLFGVRYLATLFGLTLLSHQFGGFLGAYLGGLAIAHTGNYQWMWYADMALAGLAAVVNLPIREAPIGRLAAA